MGNEASKEENQEKKILRSPNVGQASDLYWASRAGDVEAVRQILATTNFTDLNHLEPNGSTALHAASFFGHADVVRLLLQERGVMRHRKNRHGLTAYEEAANDEIRQLFHRPNSKRFCDDRTDDDGNLFNFTGDQLSEDDEDDDEVSDDFVQGYDNELQVKALKSGMQLAKTMISSPILRPIIFRLMRHSDGLESINIDGEAINKLQVLIDEKVTSTHPEYDKACELLSKYRNTKKPEHLLRLYSLETPFYGGLGIDEKSEHLLILLLLRLSNLKARAFRGRTYRGLSMMPTDLKPYRKAVRKKGSIIWTHTFCSTSIDEAVARGFMSTSCGEKLRVLMIFDFPQPCDMAIQLHALSAALPCISDFEDEREVLLLPRTMFHVVSITNDDRNGQYTIHLENVLPKLDLMALRAAGRNGSLESIEL